ncbi:MAG: ATP/GTP-binding protein, partial [Candidatus Methanomethyliaceae archaeon]|nr:ATP/GTP-binding protein [Candidatus Methanomethyliaceae archaeon]MDW7971186.1 ATP/GTP-binding protein [Nitrososphaerota archaeon]
RFRAPQINCISKVDLLSEEELRKASKWIEEPIMLKEAFLSESSNLRREISERVFEALMEMGGLGEFIFISSYSGQGMDNLYAQIQRIHTGGINI